MISWMRKKKKISALSMINAEYLVASMGSCEVVWLRKLFGELFEKVPHMNVIYCDNKSWILLSKNCIFNDRSMHIKIRYHYIWDMA